MTEHELNSLGVQQRRVMEVIWQQEGATVQDVLETINGETPDSPLAYTTMLTTMQKLEKAGWLRHEKSEEHLRAYVYYPTRNRNEAIGSSLQAFADTFLDGSKTLLFQHFVEDTDLTAEEFDEIREMIKKRRRPKS